MATSIRIAPDIERRLDLLAARTGRSNTCCLREIIEQQGIEDMEDYYLASDVLERVRKGREQTHSAAAVREDLGLGD
jgi:RHH-type rel operon transcriptional repressor/antitoxin RelB